LAIVTQLLNAASIGTLTFSLRQLTLCISFLFNLSPTYVDGIAPASWSIGVEMLFYLLFPVVLAMAGTIGRAVLVTAAFILISLGYAAVVSQLGLSPSFIVHGLAYNLPYFGFGLIAFQLLGRIDVRLGSSVTCLGLILLLATWKCSWLAAPQFGRIVNDLYTLSWGVPFGLICLGMALDPLPLLSNRVTQFLGKISFGLYLGHPQIIFWLSRFGFYDRLQRLPGGSGVTFPLAVCVTAAFLVPIAWLLFVFIESPGINLGRRLARGLRRQSNVIPALT
jgi:peptidoglycan/LPS O-acetylase OafA/YrhL